MGKKTKYDMIPIEHWIASNPNIARVQHEWFEEDMKSIQHRVNDSIVKLLLDSWNKNAASRFNILTATWALDHIYKDL